MNKIRIIFILILAGNLFSTCTKVEKTMMVSTSATSNVWYNSAKVSGKVIDLGDYYYVNDYGHCYSKTPNVTISNSTVTRLEEHYNLKDGYIFTSDITNLQPGTKYYVKSYITTYSGTIYGKEINFTTLTLPATVNDADGNVYNSLIIGTQVWLKENLKTTKYNDNTSIPLVTDNTAWSNLTTPGYCWYNNNSSYKNTYGALYNWYALNTGKLCPTGWHVPSASEWLTLETYLGGSGVAGGKMKEAGTSHWASPNNYATNESFFTALPGGKRYYDYGALFYDMSSNFHCWSSTSLTTAYAASRVIVYYYGDIGSASTNKKDGQSVRCIKN